jgi:hypothetical protein
MQESSSLFEVLFKRKITDTNSIEYLQQIADKYPFFSPAQFYLLQQKDQQSEDYNKQAAKTSVLFNNPYWLNFQLLKAQEPIIENNAIRKEVVQQPEPIKTEPVTEEALIFEPLYTSDYFLSQGIKLNDDTQPTDKLGKQLKSFTEWLKTMKKINAEKMQVDLTAQTDTNVEKLAERSNTEDEVLTETMAEVLMQQGKAEKAIEVYEKLSLLNPSKNVYFAAKIQHYFRPDRIGPKPQGWRIGGQSRWL